MTRITVKFALMMLLGIVVPAQVVEAVPREAQATAPAQSEDATQPSANADNLYRLFPGDVIELRFFFDPELNETLQIRPDGKVSLQLIGEVQMSGKTVEQLKSELQKSYSKQLKRPEINVVVRNFAAQKVYITGEVMKPGLVNMPGQLTLIEAIGEAGGIKTTGNTKKVILIRKSAANVPERREILLSAKGKPTEEAALQLRPFDIIMVPETKIAQVDRWIDQHLRQTNPANLAVGFQYIWQNQPGTIPF